MKQSAIYVIYIFFLDFHKFTLFFCFCTSYISDSNRTLERELRNPATPRVIYCLQMTLSLVGILMIQVSPVSQRYPAPESSAAWPVTFFSENVSL